MSTGDDDAFGGNGDDASGDDKSGSIFADLPVVPGTGSKWPRVVRREAAGRAAAAARGKTGMLVRIGGGGAGGTGDGMPFSTPLGFTFRVRCHTANGFSAW